MYKGVVFEYKVSTRSKLRWSKGRALKYTVKVSITVYCAKSSVLFFRKYDFSDEKNLEFETNIRDISQISSSSIFFSVIALFEKPQGRHVFTELKLESSILGIRDLADIQCGIRENAECLDGIRELTTTRATGFAEILERDVVLGKNGTRVRDDRSWG